MCIICFGRQSVVLLYHHKCAYELFPFPIWSVFLSSHWKLKGGCDCVFVTVCFVLYPFRLNFQITSLLKWSQDLVWIEYIVARFTLVQYIYIITYCLWGSTIRVLTQVLDRTDGFFFFFFFILCIYFYYYYYQSRLLNPYCLRPRVYDVFVCLSNWMFVGLFCLEL